MIDPIVELEGLHRLARCRARSRVTEVVQSNGSLLVVGAAIPVKPRIEHVWVRSGLRRPPHLTSTWLG